MLAGVSVDYYTQLERGNLAGVSESVLNAVAQALHFDEAESAHLFDLAQSASGSPPRRRRPPARQVRPGVQIVLDSMISAPAWVRNERMDIVATNKLGHAMHAELFDDPGHAPNIARFVFLDPRSQNFYPEWDAVADTVVANLRGAAGRNPYDKELSNLVGELSTRSETFGTRWATHDVRLHRSGTKQLHHPVVGDLELKFEAFELPSDPGLTMFVYAAEPNSASEDALKVLASWAVTHSTKQSRPATR